MNGSGFGLRVAAYRERFDTVLAHRLPAVAQVPTQLHEAMRYAALGGKRLRALLVYAAGETLGAAAGTLDDAACAVELIHAYSLVHDDLPAMDDDSLRRGQPTVHVAFDEATAILVGDALQALAFEVLTRDESGLPADARLAMVRALAAASGSLGMVGGQALDLAAEGQRLELADLQMLHSRKTGALIHACVQLAACARPGLPAVERDALDGYGQHLGLAYQIQDDVLDIESDSASLGKTAGKDLVAAKSTYPSVMGLSAAKQRASALFEAARGALAPFSERAEPLQWMLQHIEKRDH